MSDLSRTDLLQAKRLMLGLFRDLKSQRVARNLGKFNDKFYQHLAKVEESLDAGSFEYAAYTAFSVEKKSSTPDNPSYRAILAPSVHDRWVSLAALICLCRFLQDHLGESENAAASIRLLSGVDVTAVKPFRLPTLPETICLWWRQGFRYGVCLDVKGFFPVTDRARAKKEVECLVPREAAPRLWTVLDAYFSGFEADFSKLKCEHPPTTGLPQGNPLSPVIAGVAFKSIATHPRMFELRDVKVVRYVDDVLVMAHSAAQRDKALSIVQSIVKANGLECEPSKTQKFGPKNEFEYLGRTFLEGQSYIPTSAVEKVIAKLQPATCTPESPSRRASHRKPIPIDIVHKQVQIVRSWRSAYGSSILREDEACRISRALCKSVDDMLTSVGITDPKVLRSARTMVPDWSSLRPSVPTEFTGVEPELADLQYAEVNHAITLAKEHDSSIVE